MAWKKAIRHHCVWSSAITKRSRPRAENVEENDDDDDDDEAVMSAVAAAKDDDDEGMATIADR